MSDALSRDVQKAIVALAMREDDLLTPTMALDILATARQRSADPAAVLIEYVPELQLRAVLADELDMDLADLNSPENSWIPDTATMRELNLETLRTASAVVLRDATGQVVVAMVDPFIYDETRTYLRQELGEFRLAMGVPTQIYACLSLLAAEDTSILAELEQLNELDEAEERTEAVKVVERRSPLVDWVDQLFARAAVEGASDVHMMFQRDQSLMIRFRVDGVLSSVPVPRQLRGRETEIVGALLNKCPTINPSDRLRPQDGTFSFTTPRGKRIDTRLGMLPQSNGPTIVTRLLDPDNVRRSLDDMGFAPQSLALMRAAVAKPQGMVLLVGPTGSGKRLTLTTKVPTPTGDTTMGRLRVGDWVLGRDGAPCQVTGLSPVEASPQLYRVRFSDGQVVVADADHQWLVSSHHARNGTQPEKDLNAIDRFARAHADADALDALANTWPPATWLTASELFNILTTHALTAEFASAAVVGRGLTATDCPARKVTTGTGTTDSGQYVSATTAAGKPHVCVSEHPAAVAFRSLATRLRERFALAPSVANLSRLTTGEMLANGLRTAAGNATYAVPVAEPIDLPEAQLPIDAYLLGYWLGNGTTSSDDPVNPALRPADLADVGVLQRKHIPLTYLRASNGQRLALLRGLMDSEGTIAESGACELTLSDRTLALDALELIRSLGIKAAVSWDHDHDRGPVDGKSRHRVGFTTTQAVLRLPHKAERVPVAVRETERWNYIVDVEPVLPTDADYGPARCISVDSPDHTYLCGDGFVVTSNTTSLYGLLNELDSTKLQVLTAEDPIEYQMERIGQTQIRSGLGDKSLTFDQALRAMLRLDPNVILIGEIRDRETAKTALHASMTGHLLLSTLHTNSALGVVTRLAELGAEPFAVGDSLSLAASQRLVRRIHSCGVVEAPTEAEVAFFLRQGFAVPDTVRHPQPRGCPGCRNSGFQGRIPVLEAFAPTAEIRSMIATQQPLPEIKKVASENGYVSLLQDGYRHVATGATTVAELLRCLDTGDQ